MPGAEADGDAPVKAEIAHDEDDSKLYCVCKSGYDEDKVMIACDRCDSPKYVV